MICLSPLATHSLLFGLLLLAGAIAYIKIRRTGGTR